MNMIIDDWEYHTRMIVDIAKRNGGALVLAYDPHPERTDTPTARAVIGNVDSFLMLLVALVADATKDSGAPPCELICDMVKEGVAELRRRQRKGGRHDESDTFH